MSKSKGMTLVETLFAFSIFVSLITIIFSLYVNGLEHYSKINDEYEKYLHVQNEKELQLWKTNELDSSLNEVLH